jgi:hypothetical protein
MVCISNRLLRQFLTFVEALAFLGIAAWIAKTYLAGVLAQEPTAKNLELAVKLDPGNAEYHLRLGRFYEYNIADIQPDKAVEHFRRAIQLSPYDPRGWLDLATAVGFQGKTSEAALCLRRANFLAPNIPAYQWPIANFYLLQGDTDEAFRHFKAVLAGTSQYDRSVFDIAWKASGDPDKILEELIPRSLATEFSYLYYLLPLQRFTEAQAVWKRIVSEQEKFTPQQAAGYIDSLIQAHRPEQAFQVWMDVQRRGLLPGLTLGASENLITNGDFEAEPLNMGFDWHIVAVEGVYAGLDTATYHSPSHGLLVQFPGEQNLDYRQVYQYVKVSPRHAYRLQASMKTEGITTDSGPRLEVLDPYDSRALDKLTEDLVGSTDGWTSPMLDFKTGPKTELIMVRLTRLPSRKLDNLIGGKVWLDDVRLTALPE